MSEKIFKEVVVIADQRPDGVPIDLYSDDLDQYTAQDLQAILGALHIVCRSVTHYSSPRDFIQNISLHSDSIVLPLWSGKGSRNRTALVAAIAEAMNISCFGADAYTYIVCQDKCITKGFALELGLRTPAGITVRSLADLSKLNALALPIVVKPALEGSSIGISKENLCRCQEDASKRCLELLRRFGQPILAEHFIEGPEVTVTIWANLKGIQMLQCVEIFDSTGQFDFSKTLWSFELKSAFERPKKGERPYCLEKPDELLLATLFHNLGTSVLIRVDGRIDRDGRFVFLEVNPEPILTRAGSVATSFRIHGFDFPEMFFQLLHPYDVQSIGKLQ